MIYMYKGALRTLEKRALSLVCEGCTEFHYPRVYKRNLNRLIKCKQI